MIKVNVMSKSIFVIYDMKTGTILEINKANGDTSSQYYGIGAARAALTRFHNKQDPFAPKYFSTPQYAVAEREYYIKKIKRGL
tara:strand:+ start:6 stop:254 length:249 start_codon:yes stop_codon:yes gene_type:complete